MSKTVSIREKDETVLRLVNQGFDDVQRVREQTTLSWREVDYAVDKLEEMGLLQVEEQDGFTTRVVDGQKRKFRSPRRLSLTYEGDKVLEDADGGEGVFDDMGREELVETVRRLEDRVEVLERDLEVFRRQVASRLE